MDKKKFIIGFIGDMLVVIGFFLFILGGYKACQSNFGMEIQLKLLILTSLGSILLMHLGWEIIDSVDNK